MRTSEETKDSWRTGLHGRCTVHLDQNSMRDVVLPVAGQLNLPHPSLDNGEAFEQQGISFVGSIAPAFGGPGFFPEPIP